MSVWRQGTQENRMN